MAVHRNGRYDPVRPKLITQRKHPVKEHELMYGLAHLELWAHVVAKRIPYALVFEDDTFIRGVQAPNWKAMLEQVSLSPAHYC